MQAAVWARGRRRRKKKSLSRYPPPFLPRNSLSLAPPSLASPAGKQWPAEVAAQNSKWEYYSPASKYGRCRLCSSELSRPSCAAPTRSPIVSSRAPRASACLALCTQKKYTSPPHWLWPNQARQVSHNCAFYLVQV